MSLSALLATALLVSPVLAFPGTAPLVAWSAGPSHASLDSLVSQVERKGPLVQAGEVYAVLSGDRTLCDLDGLLVIHQSELHASDLASLPTVASTYLPSASLSIPYVVAASHSSLTESLESIAKSCGSSLSTFAGGEHIGGDIKMALVESSQASPEDGGLVWEDALVSQHISSFVAAHPDSHLIILTSSPSTSPITLQSRREVVFEDYEDNEDAPVQAADIVQPVNGTIPEGAPLLARYQILSTPLVSMLLVSLGVLLPVLAFGIMALLSISVPPRMDNVKGIVTSEKKNQ